MERAVPVRKSHTSTADLLTWSATGPDAASASPVASSRPSLKVNSRARVLLHVFDLIGLLFSV